MPGCGKGELIMRLSSSVVRAATHASVSRAVQHRPIHDPDIRRRPAPRYRSLGKLRLPRITTRRWVIAVAIMAAAFWVSVLGARSHFYAIRAGQHGLMEWALPC